MSDPGSPRLVDSFSVPKDVLREFEELAEEENYDPFAETASKRQIASRYSRVVEVLVEGCVLLSALFITIVAFAVRTDRRAAWPVAVMPQLAVRADFIGNHTPILMHCSPAGLYSYPSYFPSGNWHDASRHNLG